LDGFPLTIERARRWAGIFSAYFSTQTLIQLLGIATGLLFVRFMPVREFALYTLAFSVITFFNFLSDLGSTTSLLHFFHRTAREGGDFGSYVAAVLSLRRWAFAAGAVAVVVAFPLAAHAKGYSAEALPTTAGILLCVWFQIQVSLRILSLRLHDRYDLSYRAEIAGSGLRLALGGTMVLITQLQAWLGVLATAAGSALSNFLARPEAPLPPPPAGLRPYRRQVLRYLLPTFPAAFYFAVQSPLLIWLAATFGSTRSIAEIGALGRLGLIVGIFSGLIGTVFMPRLARITDERTYRARFLQFGAVLALFAVVLTATAAALPRAFLFLLGASYERLTGEVVLVVAGAGFHLLDGYLVNVNLARSWTRWQSAFLVVQLACQAVLVALLPLSETRNVLLFQLLSAAVALSLQVVVAFLGFRRPEWVYWA
jgi:O-antigen/teichoic acid export membrane protein